MINDDIDFAKRLIEENMENKETANPFYKLYAFSNENLGGYLNTKNFQGTTVLTTGSSGDQAFNISLNGGKKIIVFDINPFVKYYFNLKKMGIMCLSRRAFLDFFNFCNDKRVFNEKTFIKLEDNLDNDTKLFWQNLFSSFSPSLISKNLFMPSNINMITNIVVNPYLHRDNYCKMAQLLSKCEIDFLNKDIRDISNLDIKFDYIILSNILDYLFNFSNALVDSLEDYKKLLKNVSSLLKNYGSMFFHYFWYYRWNNNYEKISCYFHNDPFIKTIYFDSIHSINKDNSSLKEMAKPHLHDAIMIYCKRM